MDKLYDLETSLFKGEYLNNKGYLENIFHKNFMEYGKSGLVYYKQDTIDSLYGIGDRNIKIYDFTSEKLDDHTYIVHYVSENEDGISVYRTSIWVGDDNLQLLFHQGTIRKK